MCTSKSPKGMHNLMSLDKGDYDIHVSLRKKVLMDSLNYVDMFQNLKIH